jgi:hypothetical protein
MTAGAHAAAPLKGPQRTAVNGTKQAPSYNTMTTPNDSQHRPKRSEFSVLRLLASFAWIAVACSIIAPSMLDLSASARTAIYVVGGLAALVFCGCAVIGIVYVRNRHRNQETLPGASEPHPTREKH